MYINIDIVEVHVLVTSKNLRRLILAFSIILISTFSVNEVKAETIDDLKAYLGMTVEERDSIKIKIEEYNEDGSYKDNCDGDKDKGMTSKKTDNSNDIEDMKARLKKLEDKYERDFKNNDKAKDMIKLLEAIRELKSSINEQGGNRKYITNIDIDNLIAGSSRSSLELNTMNKYGGIDFDIGTVGNMAISPVDKFLKLVTPYGYKLDEDDKIEFKHDKIDLGAPCNHSIVSQWNGRVEYIEDDDIVEDCSIVTINHGQGLYTIYYHIVPGQIYEGKYVNQGNEIGKAGNTKINKIGKENHIGFQIVLDNDTVNPILIFGNRGKPMYEDWLKKSYDKYAVSEGEEYYYIDSMSKENVNKEDTGKNTIEGAAEVIDDYRRPDPGTLR